MTTKTRSPEAHPHRQPSPSKPTGDMRAIAYVRVSASSQVGGHSLDAQERLFHELCRLRGWQPGRVYREAGIPAASDSMDNRPTLRQLLEDASQGQFDIVVVHSLDRWSRSLQVTLETAAALSQRGVSLVSAAQQLELSRSGKP